MTLEQLEQEAKEIYEFMNIPIDDDIVQATEKGNMLAVYINRTGFMLAQAKLLPKSRTQLRSREDNIRADWTEVFSEDTKLSY